MSLALLCLGDIERAKAASEKYEQLAPGDSFALDIKFRVAVAEKRVEDARKLLAVMKSRAEKGDELHYLIAQEECLLGDYAAAAESISRAFKAGDSNFGADIVWFVPEDWPNDPDIQSALNQPELVALWDIRRKNLASYPRAETQQ